MCLRGIGGKRNGVWSADHIQERNEDNGALSYEDARRDCLVRLGCWVHNPNIMDIRIVIWESELTDCVRTL